LIVKRELFDPSGTLLWTSNESEAKLAGVLSEITNDNLASVVRELVGQPAQPACTVADIMQAAEQLNYVARAGAPPGFLNVLPRGALLQYRIDSLNRGHTAALDATRIDFPLVFDRRTADLTSLTETFEQQNRMFKLTGSDQELRLAYAADPGLLSFLRGRQLDSTKLPYVIYSPMPVFKRYLSGELGITSMRQYTLPDLHGLCSQSTAADLYVVLLKSASHSSQMLFGDDCAQFIELAPEMVTRDPALASKLAQAANQYTVARHLDSQTRYFCVKGGINVYMGAGTIMLFNFQWDETNSDRFNIRLRDDPQGITIIHSTLAGAWPKVLPAFIGRALSGRTNRAVPIQYASEQVTLLPVRDSHLSACDDLKEHLNAAGFRVAISSRTNKSLGRRINELRADWRPYHAVVGDREANTPASVTVRSTTGRDEWSLQDFFDTYSSLVNIFRSDDEPSRVDLPY
jgi:threonyl-tRNA synthetase